ncbi:Bifunctional DNA primase/polymerase, N-terminal [Paractinoplanes atraurantiacus]|uniref:Bifunctional DNA primase/polymerase, N-terminal n=2 Tax=Paractinoplanes atraurantiacus TaxID=1036182 RepID=A0A285HE70_9ACTN|nr:Bifunctional DNA primase/polymerase, N-terminal [Actinoplanes atraurantiacus]
MACHPALESWEDSASADPAQVQSWWRHRPYSVLLATGRLFDVLEVPAALGLRVLGTARLHTGVLGVQRADARGPVAVTAAGRWMFLVRAGVPLRPELDHRLDVVRHGAGSWVPAAPTRMIEGPVRWAVPPEQAQWWLPDAEVVQSLLVDALGTLPERHVTVPRQLSTTRRST